MTAFDPKRTFVELTIKSDPDAIGGVDLARLAVLFGMCLSVCGCSQNLVKDASLESPDDSVLVLGVDRENSFVSLRPLTVRKSGLFTQSAWPGGFMTKPANGFVVAKVRGGDTWGLVVVMFKGQVYQPCLDNDPVRGEIPVRAMTFDIPKGKVVYLGHIDYDVDAYSLTIKYRWDQDSAKKYVDENHPRLRGRLEAWDYKSRWIAMACSHNARYRLFGPADR